MNPRSKLCKFATLWLLLPGTCAPLRAQDIFLQHERKAFQPTGGITYFVEENFEGTGLPAGWTAGNVTHDYDYTTTVLQGSQSYQVVASASSPTLQSPTFTGAATTEYYFMIHYTTAPTTAHRAFFVLNNTTECCRMTVGTSMIPSIRAGGGTDQVSTDAMSLNTTYHVWLRVVAGSGTNGFCSVAYSTDGTRPSSGSKYKESINGTFTVNPDRVRIGIANGNTWTAIFDRVLGTDDTIPNNP